MSNRGFKITVFLLCLVSAFVLVGFTQKGESEREQKIYSFVQVPEEYCNDEKWTGDWVEMECGGQKFFYFGCGICCLSNVYSTFYDVPLRPDAMFEWARKYGDYHPESGRGALSWKQLRKMYEHFGCVVQTKHKPENYADFQNDVQNSETTMVLVCKYNDDKLWFYTLGHYVNLWEYNPQDDTVFVTDSSGMFNRQRVNLEDVYSALKTSSDAQYMCIDRKENE
ncbi:MAG: hypothetical protein Q4E54_00460 [Lachnospiraceae bacterium]|nr:hypothetical protein [Lachnospiraceae bacterium]